MTTLGFCESLHIRSLRRYRCVYVEGFAGPQNNSKELSVVVHSWRLSIQKAEAGG